MKSQQNLISIVIYGFEKEWFSLKQLNVYRDLWKDKINECNNNNDRYNLSTDWQYAINSLEFYELTLIAKKISEKS